MIWWRVVLDKDGSIKTAEQVEYAGQGSKLVRFVEANTKAEACSIAKRWHENRKQIERRCEQKRLAAARSAGMCTRCKCRKARKNRVQCERCSEQQAARDPRRGGQRAGFVAKTPEQSFADYTYKNRQSSRLRIHAKVCLRQFDALGPVEFRAWLVSEIARREPSPQERAVT